MSYIKPNYKFWEIHELQKLPLETKIQISVDVLKQAFELSREESDVNLYF